MLSIFSSNYFCTLDISCPETACSICQRRTDMPGRGSCRPVALEPAAAGAGRSLLTNPAAWEGLRLFSPLKPAQCWISKLLGFFFQLLKELLACHINALIVNTGRFLTSALSPGCGMTLSYRIILDARVGLFNPSPNSNRLLFRECQTTCSSGSNNAGKGWQFMRLSHVKCHSTSSNTQTQRGHKVPHNIQT